MKAVQYLRTGQPVEVREVPTPEPGPGQVLLKVTAAGLCHSDIAVMAMTDEQRGFDLPLTLGHEGAGVVHKLGAGVTDVAEGDSVIVYGPWGCGLCRQCAEGRENYCLNAAARGIRPPGLGAPGALAEYMIVDDVRHLVPIGDLDPVATVPLTDAGLTPYHAIGMSLPKLRPGSTTVVIGAGGLGHVGIQLLRALTATRIIALDLNDDKLKLAEEVGAHDTMVSDDQAAAKIRDLTNGVGADVVLDFVGAQATVTLAGAAAAVNSDITIVGIAGGALPVGFGSLPFECRVASPYWGTRGELLDLVEMAKLGTVSVEVERYGIDDAPTAYARLHDGQVRGRAVVVP
ncbi:NAD(P)-dependent alcohol dehydrogenase [Hamadaea tsunoensis]|uniref:NAD(P)-dependent alcohol dehydrogenase n=1 Tax=Hamadaea tsunoensis TaxID=53368 RepID=UPI0003FBFFD8|nr:NAD(P)-dependent alcohol dehydrogenase [Hamadaea tsunoensis]